MIRLFSLVCGKRFYTTRSGKPAILAKVRIAGYLNRFRK